MGGFLWFMNISIKNNLSSSANLIMSLANREVLDLDSSTGSDLLDIEINSDGLGDIGSMVQVIKGGIIVLHSEGVGENIITKIDGFSDYEINGVIYTVLRVTDKHATVIVAQRVDQVKKIFYVLASLIMGVYSILWIFLLLTFKKVSKNVSIKVKEDLELSLGGNRGFIDDLEPVRVAIDSYIKELKRVNEAERSFLEHASHELRTPLTVAILRSEAHPDDKVLADACLRMEEIVTTFLNISKGGNSNFSDFLIKDVVLDVLEEIFEKFPDSEINFNGLEDVYMHGSEILFKLSLSNLILNSLQKGGVNVDVLIDDKNIIVRDYILPMVENQAIRGYGIGLKIVSLCSSLLGGNFEIKNNEFGGVDAILSFSSLVIKS